MREIYFRGKDEWGNWRIGDLIYATLGAGQKPMIMDAYDEFDPNNNMFEVTPDTVGQFTGLTDADGREIYEGDIVTFGRGTEPSAVRWDNEFAYFVIMKSLLLGHACKAVRVIGNVHDNPNLLEADDARD